MHEAGEHVPYIPGLLRPFMKSEKKPKEDPNNPVIKLVGSTFDEVLNTKMVFSVSL